MRSNIFLSGLHHTTTLHLFLVLSVWVPLLAPRLTHGQTYNVLYSFKRPTGDGIVPIALLPQANGILYGGTCYGGGSYNGIAFRLSPKGKETVLYNFLAGYGSCPNSLLPWKGEFYGATSEGGAHAAGAFFKLDKKGNESVLYSFSGPRYANVPGLSFGDGNGVFYGTTFAGGLYGWGTIFQVDTAGKERVLYSFTGGSDGKHPFGLVRDDEGNIYGTTGYGGDPTCSQPNDACGTLFKLDAAGKLTTLHMFNGAPDGASPSTSLVRDASGNLYGATGGGGDTSCAPPWGCGTVFMVDASGHERLLYSFTGAADGAAPQGNLLRDNSGNLYGTANLGGDTNCGVYYVKGCGVVFKLDTTGKETVLHTFTSSPDGAYPELLILNPAGDLYGTTFAGGDANCIILHYWQGCGTVFKLTP
jgi:uncharacterized repeat protein (TIGR03803 family)